MATQLPTVAEYQKWDKEQLITRLLKIEKELSEAKGIQLTSPATEDTGRAKSPARHSTRHIALKFAYLGKNYNGFEHHNGNATNLPTVEEVLFKALARSRLIPLNAVSPEQSTGNPFAQDPLPITLSLEDCEYSKCGRTDKGVSAFGQVIGIRVRSNRPLPKEEIEQVSQPKDEASELDFDIKLSDSEPEPKSFDDIKDEINYCHKLNRLLPEDIRVLAWCPNPPTGFSARHSCRERRYKYFFTQPAFPLYDGPGSKANGRPASGMLDIDAMKAAAKLYEGLHDFRNLCKIDGSKQLTNFMRRINYSNIEEVGEDPFSENAEGKGLTPRPKVYAFVLHGSAFLWHQVRHMVAILFLVGQGFEKPSVVSELLDVQKNPRRPVYEMADEAPLVLWDCIFPNKEVVPGEALEDGLPWIYADLGSDGLRTTSQRNKSLLGEMWSVWRGHKMDEILSQKLLDLISGSSSASLQQATTVFEGSQRQPKRSELVFQGADLPASKGTYIPVMQLSVKESVEEVNAKWLRRKAQGSSAAPTASEERNDKTFTA